MSHLPESTVRGGHHTAGRSPLECLKPAAGASALDLTGMIQVVRRDAWTRYTDCRALLDSLAQRALGKSRRSPPAEPTILVVQKVDGLGPASCPACAVNQLLPFRAKRPRGPPLIRRRTAYPPIRRMDHQFVNVVTSRSGRHSTWVVESPRTEPRRVVTCQALWSNASSTRASKSRTRMSLGHPAILVPAAGQ